MREGIRNFMVGLTSIAALIGLAALLMSFGELDPLLHPRYQLLIKTENAAGLRPGATVEYDGVPVGVVDSVYVAQDPQYPVRIVCLIDASVQIPADAKPLATAALIGGSASLQFQAPPHGEAARGNFLPSDGKAEIIGPVRGGLLAQITEQLDQRMKPISESLERFNRLSDTYVSLGQNLNALFEPQTPEQLAGGEPPNLRSAVIKLNQALDQATEALTLAKSFLGDEQVNADARNAVKKANTLIEQATSAIDRYTKLADSLQTNTEQLTKKLLPLTDALAETLEDVHRVSKLATDGKGTVGMLLNNPDLYNSLNDAAVRLEQTLKQAQLLIDKLRQEGVYINF